MNCDELKHALDDYRDGTLPEPRRAAVEAHLDACGTCARQYQRESQWLSLLAEEPAVRGGSAFAAATLEALDACDEPVARIGRGRWAVAAAVLLAGVIGTIVMLATPEPAPRFARALSGGDDPVSVLVLDVAGQLDAPLVWRGSFDQDAALTTLKTLAELFAEQPDPAIRG